MFFILFMFFSVILLFMNLIYSNLIFWWSSMVILTLIFLFVNKQKGIFSSSLNYFIFQEFLGLMFLVFLGTFLQFFILMLKVGVSPLHFWVYSVVNNLEGYLLMWFLTFQKLPFVPLLFYYFSIFWSLVLLFGIFICYIQIYVIKNFKLMFFISSTESFNWLLLGFFFGIWSVLFFIIFYFFNMLFLIYYQNFSGKGNMLLETSLVFLNMPLTVSFYLKVFMLFLILTSTDIYILFLLLMMFLSSLSFFSWFSYLNLNSSKFFKDGNHKFMFFIFISFFFIIF